MQPFNSSSQQAEAGGSLSLRPVLFIQFLNGHGCTGKPCPERNTPTTTKKKKPSKIHIIGSRNPHRRRKELIPWLYPLTPTGPCSCPFPYSSCLPACLSVFLFCRHTPSNQKLNFSIMLSALTRSFEAVSHWTWSSSSFCYSRFTDPSNSPLYPTEAPELQISGHDQFIHVSKLRSSSLCYMVGLKLTI